ncbi:hypothetical protein CDL12_19556 [Handroanthus impetiginosus]|uniref:Uncharacterized protein n=1 Tax=Handroanthus impetiginosus TaxID=429701 RepID=A0A2G9GRH5_9LAMI|nr:hypothetical protein CDL12_19556 [Handroanthus impetiginosus]
MQDSPVISPAPSFNSYSNGKLAEIAARVVEELDSDEEFYVERKENSAAERAEEGRISDNRVPKLDADEVEDDFEFAFVRNTELLSPISADQIFQNGKIRPVYPVFDRDLLLGHVKFENENEKENGARKSISSESPKIRLPLRKLFIEERETTMTMSSSSSSEADDLDGVPVEMYCVWRPKEEDRQYKKTGSAGCYSKRWKLKDLLNRSNSDGSRETFVLSPQSNSGKKNENNEKQVKETPEVGGKVKSVGAAVAPAPSPPFNGDGGEKQRSSVPYRQDLVGIFGNVNGLSENSQSV